MLEIQLQYFLVPRTGYIVLDWQFSTTKKFFTFSIEKAGGKVQLRRGGSFRPRRPELKRVRIVNFRQQVRELFPEPFRDEDVLHLAFRVQIFFFQVWNLVDSVGELRYPVGQVFEIFRPKVASSVDMVA